MPDWLYETGPNGLWVFLLLTVVLGGAAAFVAGQAIASSWRPVWQVPLCAALLALGVRFLHFALFEEPFLAPGNLVVDWLVLAAAALLGFRAARAEAMVRQYGWLFERAGHLGWRSRSDANYPQRASESE
jgi:hypothetical protein